MPPEDRGRSKRELSVLEDPQARRRRVPRGALSQPPRPAARKSSAQVPSVNASVTIAALAALRRPTRRGRDGRRQQEAQECPRKVASSGA
jgi:hypothetical protein